MTKKATTASWRAFILAWSGGAYIALGFVFWTTVMTGSGDLPWGVARLLGGLVFSVGLFLVVVTGAELFTSTSMTLIARAAGRITWRQLATHWAVVYLGNLVGALTVAGIVWAGGVAELDGGSWGVTVLAAAAAKVHHGPLEALILGIGCNLVVCLAVWAAFTGSTTTDKAIAVTGPIALFVAVGFEHSVANMFMIPLGLLLKYTHPEMAEGVAGVADLTPASFLAGNLLPVTVGNILGGGVMIGLYYWILFRHRQDPGTGDSTTMSTSSRPPREGAGVQ